MHTVSRRCAAALATLLVAGGACTVQQTDIPGLSGPSDLALSVSLTASPDIINRDGVSQSAVTVVARGPDGQPRSGLPVRLDLAVGGTLADFGSLSTKNVVTNTDGRATAIYTAPPPPAAGTGGAFQIVTVVATPSGSDYFTANSFSADIRLNTPGVILPPAGTPTASFTVSPMAPTIGTVVYLDASGSQPGSGAGSIVSYDWTLGDGAEDSGVQVDTIYYVPGEYTITLRVTNDRGVSAQSSQTLTVGAGTAPVANFVFSPENPASGQNVVFDASTSTTGPGRVIVNYEWVFGDEGTPVSTSSRTYTKTGGYAVDGRYSVTLVITDSAGMVGVATSSITVGEIEDDDEEEEDP